MSDSYLASSTASACTDECGDAAAVVAACMGGVGVSLAGRVWRPRLTRETQTGWASRRQREVERHRRSVSEESESERALDETASLSLVRKRGHDMCVWGGGERERERIRRAGRV